MYPEGHLRLDLDDKPTDEKDLSPRKEMGTSTSDLTIEPKMKEKKAKKKMKKRDEESSTKDDTEKLLNELGE